VGNKARKGGREGERAQDKMQPLRTCPL
jgi:hypothetical protein